MTRLELLLNREMALQVLVSTAAPEQQRAWRFTRDAARRVIRAARQPGYLDTRLAHYDHEWMREALIEIRNAQTEQEPCDYYWDERDFIATGGRAR